jgi:hypothetical protein
MTSTVPYLMLHPGLGSLLVLASELTLDDEHSAIYVVISNRILCSFFS